MRRFNDSCETLRHIADLADRSTNPRLPPQTLDGSRFVNKAALLRAEADEIQGHDGFVVAVKRYAEEVHDLDVDGSAVSRHLHHLMMIHGVT